MSQPDVIRVLLIDDHELIRAGLRRLLDTYEAVEVVGELQTQLRPLNAAVSDPPDLILLDGDDRGVEVTIGRLLTTFKDARIIVLLSEEGLDTYRGAVHAGARGVVLKSEPPDQLFEAIEKVHQGQVWVKRSVMSDLIRELQQPSHRQRERSVPPEEPMIAQLTERERDIIRLVGDGLKNREIAQQLQISSSTVRYHLTSIYGKLEVADRLELLIFAYRHGLAE